MQMPCHISNRIERNLGHRPEKPPIFKGKRRSTMQKGATPWDRAFSLQTVSFFTAFSPPLR
jgi:hypothetical protein